MALSHLSISKTLICEKFGKLNLIGFRYKYTNPIEWVKPQKVSFCDPIKTGDRSLELNIDWTKPPMLIEQSQEYQTSKYKICRGCNSRSHKKAFVEAKKSRKPTGGCANELVKKAFSSGFLGRKYGMTRQRDELIQKVRNHKYDTSSFEVQIAAKTGIIKNLVQVHHDLPLYKSLKVYLKETIDKRKKRIYRLRQFDYRRYEWLLEQLDLEFRPTPKVCERVERKRSIRKLAAKYVDEQKTKKLMEYKNFLHSQKAGFLKHKVDTLEWARNEEIECGVTPTVSEEDIDAAKQQLEQHMSTITPQIEETHDDKCSLTI